MKLRVKYFALLREQRGQEEETLETLAATPKALYEELCAHHGFSLPVTKLMVAVNEQFGAWEQSLHDGDEVVFIPPVAGG
jgi:sulfur-carrier protein